jgi:branched-chain amino acid aminotransferase
MPELKVFIDGNFIDASKARINVQNHGLLYGDGIFEGIRAYNGRVFKLTEHIDRLFDSAKMIKLNIGCTKEQMSDAVCETLRVNKLNEAYIRLLVTRGDGDLSIDCSSCKTSTIIIIAKPLPAFMNASGVKLITSSMRRIPISVFSPNIKSLNYLNNVLCKMEAKMRGADEAVILDMNGYVSECAGDNIFMIKDNVLVTPHHVNSLKGITRETLLDMANEESWYVEDGYINKVEIRNISIFEMYAADEVFITGTAAELAPVIEIDGRKIGDGNPGKITLKLQDKFKKYVNSVGIPIREVK